MRIKHWKRLERLCDKAISDIKHDLGTVYLWMDQVLNHGSACGVTQCQLDHEEENLIGELSAIETKRDFAKRRWLYAKHDGMLRSIAFEKELGFPR